MSKLKNQYLLEKPNKPLEKNETTKTQNNESDNTKLPTFMEKKRRQIPKAPILNRKEFNETMQKTASQMKKNNNSGSVTSLKTIAKVPGLKQKSNSVRSLLAKPPKEQSLQTLLNVSQNKGNNSLDKLKKNTNLPLKNTYFEQADSKEKNDVSDVNYNLTSVNPENMKTEQREYVQQKLKPKNYDELSSTNQVFGMRKSYNYKKTGDLSNKSNKSMSIDCSKFENKKFNDDEKQSKYDRSRDKLSNNSGNNSNSPNKKSFHYKNKSLDKDFGVPAFPKLDGALDKNFDSLWNKIDMKNDSPNKPLSLNKIEDQQRNSFDINSDFSPINTNDQNRKQSDSSFFNQTQKRFKNPKLPPTPAKKIDKSPQKDPQRQSLKNIVLSNRELHKDNDVSVDKGNLVKKIKCHNSLPEIEENLNNLRRSQFRQSTSNFRINSISKKNDNDLYISNKNLSNKISSQKNLLIKESLDTTLRGNFYNSIIKNGKSSPNIKLDTSNYNIKGTPKNFNSISQKVIKTVRCDPIQEQKFQEAKTGVKKSMSEIKTMMKDITKEFMPNAGSRKPMSKTNVKKLLTTFMGDKAMKISQNNVEKKINNMLKKHESDFNYEFDKPKGLD